MDNKKRRYEFETKVKVPDMDEIRKAAGQFADPPEQESTQVKKSIPGAREAALKTHKSIMNDELSSIKSQMEELANAVILEEKKQKEEAEKEAAEKEAEAERLAFEEEKETASEEEIVDVEVIPETQESQDAEKDSAAGSSPENSSKPKKKH